MDKKSPKQLIFRSKGLLLGLFFFFLLGLLTSASSASAEQCSDCGWGGWGCGQEECLGLGNCYFVDNLGLKNDCYDCADINSCADYPDQTTCEEAPCQTLSCTWNENSDSCQRADDHDATNDPEITSFKAEYEGEGLANIGSNVTAPAEVLHTWETNDDTVEVYLECNGDASESFSFTGSEAQAGSAQISYGIWGYEEQVVQCTLTAYNQKNETVLQQLSYTVTNPNKETTCQEKGGECIANPNAMEAGKAVLEDSYNCPQDQPYCMVDTCKGANYSQSSEKWSEAGCQEEENCGKAAPQNTWDCKEKGQICCEESLEGGNQCVTNNGTCLPACNDPYVPYNGNNQQEIQDACMEKQCCVTECSQEGGQCIDANNDCENVIQGVSCPETGDICCADKSTKIDCEEEGGECVSTDSCEYKSLSNTNCGQDELCCLPNPEEEDLQLCDPYEEGIAGGFLFLDRHLVPCGRQCDDPGSVYDETASCTLCHFFLLIKNIFDLILALIIIAAILAITIAGVLYIVSAGASLVQRAKEIVKYTLIAFALLLLSWLIVYTALNFMAAKEEFIGTGDNWFEFKCDLDSPFDEGKKGKNQNRKKEIRMTADTIFP